MSFVGFGLAVGWPLDCFWLVFEWVWLGFDLIWLVSRWSLVGLWCVFGVSLVVCRLGSC